MFKNLPIRVKMMIAGGGPLILVAVLGYFTYSSVNSLMQSSAWVDHTHEVIGQAKHLEASAVDQETGMRGYLLAGKENFLDPYKKGGQEFYKVIVQLKTEVGDNPAQVQLLNEIESNIEEWHEKVTKPIIKLRHDIGDSKTMNDMAVLVGKAHGKVYFDGFRKQVALFISREEKLMNERKMKNDAGAFEMIEHTYIVIGHAYSILAHAVDMETGMRGFLLSGKDNFLDPYISGKKELFHEVTALQTTVADNPVQVALLGDMADIIKEWVKNVTEPAIALRRDIGHAKTMDDMADLVGEAKGKVYFDKFRGQIATFVEREAKLMTTRKEDAKAMSETTISTIVIGSIVTIAIALIVAWMLSGLIVKSINAVVQLLKDVAQGEGDLTKRLVVDSKDEVGQLSEWFNVFIQKIHDIIVQISKQSSSLESSSQTLMTTSESLVLGASSSQEQSTSVNDAASNINTNINSMAAAAEEMNASVTDVSASAKQVSANMTDVSQSINEMTTSIQEVAVLARDASVVSAQANELSDSATKKMSHLEQASLEIGNVTEVIKHIANQTNLLALNATIEAAAAGEAGKGFAVVAGEIKELAGRSAMAAEEIGLKINGVQENTKDALNVFSEVTAIINKIKESVTTITASVEEQEKTAGGISRNVAESSTGVSAIASSIEQMGNATGELARMSDEAATGIRSVSSGIEEVSNSASEGKLGSEKVNEISGNLTELASSLQSMVGEFVIKN